MNAATNANANVSAAMLDVTGYSGSLANAS